VQMQCLPHASPHAWSRATKFDEQTENTWKSTNNLRYGSTWSSAMALFIKEWKILNHLLPVT
jgi:hypothetical protein